MVVADGNCSLSATGGLQVVLPCPTPSVFAYEGSSNLGIRFRGGGGGGDCSKACIANRSLLSKIIASILKISIKISLRPLGKLLPAKTGDLCHILSLIPIWHMVKHLHDASEFPVPASSRWWCVMWEFKSRSYWKFMFWFHPRIWQQLSSSAHCDDTRRWWNLRFLKGMLPTYLSATPFGLQTIASKSGQKIRWTSFSTGTMGPQPVFLLLPPFAECSWLPFQVKREDFPN